MDDAPFFIIVWAEIDGEVYQEDMTLDDVPVATSRYILALKADPTVVWVSAYRRELKWERPASDPTAGRQSQD